MRMEEWKMENVLRGGFQFIAEVIDKEVPVGMIGNYLLSEGLKSAENRLIVTYVGRSNDLNRRLKEHLLDKEQYIWFWYKPAVSEHAAYEQECRDYHTYRLVHELNNVVHPAKFNDENACPVCGQ